MESDNTYIFEYGFFHLAKYIWNAYMLLCESEICSF